MAKHFHINNHQSVGKNVAPSQLDWPKKRLIKLNYARFVAKGLDYARFVAKGLHYARFVAKGLNTSFGDGSPLVIGIVARQCLYKVGRLVWVIDIIIIIYLNASFGDGSPLVIGIVARQFLYRIGRLL